MHGNAEYPGTIKELIRKAMQCGALQGNAEQCKAMQYQEQASTNEMQSTYYNARQTNAKEPTITRKPKSSETAGTGNSGKEPAEPRLERREQGARSEWGGSKEGRRKSEEALSCPLVDPRLTNKLGAVGIQNDINKHLSC